MIQLTQGGAYLVNGTDIVADTSEAARQIQAKTGITISKEEAAKNTMAYGILQEHNTSGNMDKLKKKRTMLQRVRFLPLSAVRSQSL